MLQKDNKSLIRIIKENVCTVSAAIGTMLIGFGFPKIETGNNSATWLIAIGFLMLGIAIITHQDFLSYIIKHVPKLLYKVIIWASICIIFFSIPFFISQHTTNDIKAILAENSVFDGKLTPGNDPTPVLPSNNIPSSELPQNPAILMLGDDSAVFMSKLGNFSLCRGDESFLSIKTSSDGSILLTATVLDVTDNRMVTLIDNRFKASGEFTFRAIQPDEHTLIVYDFKGNEVLNVRYINSKVIRIVGRFNLPGASEPVIIFPNGEVKLAGNTIRHFFVNAGQSSVINITD